MKKYAVIGNPIEHSISPKLHNSAFNALNINSEYSKYLLELSADANMLRKTFFELNLSGANITVPFKEIAFSASDEIDDFAQKIGSVNTLLLRDDKIHAFNTDAPGFLMAISDFKDIENALIIGAGGTARALSVALRESGANVDILNRSSLRADAFKNHDFYTHETFKPKKYDIVVNTTPAGLTFDGLPCDEEILRKIFISAKYAFDVVYGRPTRFLELANEYEIKCKDGLLMLLYQAVLAFDIFTDHQHDKDEITKAMFKALN